MMMSTSTTEEPDHRPVDDDRYEDFLRSLREGFAARAAGAPKLFTTNAVGLFAAFLDALPAARRQHYNCRACQRFVDRFGGIVTIAQDGAATSVMWDADEAPPFFRAAVRAMAHLVARAEVTGVFLCDEKTWGMPQNKSQKPPGIWHHMAVTPDRALVHKPSPILTTAQVIAEKREDHGMLCRGIAEFSADTVAQARRLLDTEALYRSEKVLGVAKWLGDLHAARGATKNARARDNLAWLAVASAPAGFCHVRSSMIGTLLEDIAAGKTFDDVARAFAAKMHPLQYQRPQAPPSDENIAQAEAIVAKLGAAGALARRFARLEDIQTVWTPAPAKIETPKGEGVFGHLRGKAKDAAPQIEQPAVTTTWAKFARTVLPEAERIEFLVPRGASNFAAFITAANADALPILQWDSEEKRNPVSWYLYNGGSMPQAWNLPPGAPVAVTAVALKPSMWAGEDKFAHHGKGVMFVLDGARDTRHERSGGLFPEQLRAEYHGVRRTIEAYSMGAAIAGRDEATACGIFLQTGTGSAFGGAPTFRVTSNGAQTMYRLDRWD